MPVRLSNHSIFTKNILLLYAVMLLFLTTADGLMSYLSPVIMEQALGSASRMGLILATSSVVGTLCDFIFPKVFSRKKSVFFGKMVFSFVLLFPLAFLVSRHVLSFVFAMVIWGVYFEGMVFSNYLFVHEHVRASSHAFAWGVLVTMKNIGWVIGPFVAGVLIGQGDRLPLLLALSFYFLALCLFGFVQLFDLKGRDGLGAKRHVQTKAQSMVKELWIWFTYAKVLWPLLGMVLFLYLIDSAFFSIGPLFEESLSNGHHWGGFFISMYTIPGVLMGVLTGFFARPFGKKRAAFFGGVIGGIGLIFMSQSSSVPNILAATFLSSLGLSILYPEIEAVFEDYVARAKSSGSDIVGMSALMGSIGYVIGPIANGYLSDRIGSQQVFGLWGLLLGVYSALMFFVVKRKVHLPQQAVAKLLRRRI